MMEMNLLTKSKIQRQKVKYFKNPLQLALVLLFITVLVFLSLHIIVMHSYNNCLQINIKQNVNIPEQQEVDIGFNLISNSNYDHVSTTRVVGARKHKQQAPENIINDIPDECRRERLVLRRTYNFRKEANSYIEKVCDRKLLKCQRQEGKKVFPVNATSIATWQSLYDELKFVEKGGWWQPNDCVALSKVAIIVPYRNREVHLKIFLRNMHAFLHQQNIHYRIFVVEQTDESPFNRGKLLNVGFKEAMKTFPFSCIVFHDVDLLPEDLRNFYGCLASPQHMCVAIDKYDYKLLYEELFGGVEMFRKEHFEQINGFTNSFWGWGAEDDNLYKRLKWKNLQLWRQSHEIGRYKMLSHASQESKGISKRKELLKESVKHFNADGLSNLQYDVISTEEKNLFTHISVNLQKNKDPQITIQGSPSN